MSSSTGYYTPNIPNSNQKRHWDGTLVTLPAEVKLTDSKNGQLFAEGLMQVSDDGWLVVSKDGKTQVEGWLRFVGGPHGGPFDIAILTEGQWHADVRCLPLS